MSRSSSSQWSVLAALLLAFSVSRPAAGSTVFSDDIESGTANWSLQSPWGTYSPTTRGSRALTDSPSGNYANSANTAATMASSISLAAASSSASVTFWHYYALETNYDYGNLEISTNGGTSWSALQRWTGSSGWVQTTVSLAAYTGQTNVRLRFRLTSDNSSVSDGWGFDDIVIDDGRLPVMLTAPNGGEIYAGNSSKTVTWIYDGSLATAASFRLLLSTDGGSTYPQTIASALPLTTRAYDWTLPALNTSTARVRAQMLDGVGTVLYSDDSNASFTIDSTPPVAPGLSGPSNGGCVGPQPAFSWASSVGAATYTVSVQPSSGAAVDMAGVSGTSLGWPAAKSLVEAGNPYTWWVTAIDAAGNVARSSSQSFFVDTTPPAAFSLAEPADGTWKRSTDLSFSWNGSSDAGCGLSKYRLYVDGSLCLDNIAAGTTTAASSALSCSPGDGDHRWAIAAQDGAGNVRWATQAPDGTGGWTVRIDNLGPGLVGRKTLSVGANNIPPYYSRSTGLAVQPGQAVRVTASGSWCFENGGGCSGSYCYGPDGDNNSSPRAVSYCPFGGLVAQIGSGSFKCVGSSTSFVSTDTGTLTLAANDDDRSNCQYYSVGATATVSEAGALDPLTPTSGALITNRTPAFSWGPATDAGVGGATYVLLMDGSPAAAATTGTTASVAASLADGSHSWAVRATDALGNVSTGPTSTFTVDTTPPIAFAVLTPADRSCTALPTPNLCWAASSDTHGLVGYQLWVDGDLSVDAIPESTLCSTPSAALSPGVHSWFVVARDRAGNERQSTSASLGTILFTDDFEAGTTLWQLATGWGRESVADRAGSALSDSPGTNYPNGSNRAATLTSPIALGTAGASAKLSFWHRYDFENSYDYGRVEISTDNGQTWRELAGFTSTQATWTQVVLPINATGASALLLRFRQTSDQGGNRAGWLIDDVAVGDGQADMGVIVDRDAPAAFALTAPADAGTVDTLMPTFQWTASSDVGGLAAYEVWVDGARTARVGSTQLSWTPSAALGAGTHSWLVKAIDVCGGSTASPIRSVTTRQCAPGTAEACTGNGTGACRPGTRTCTAAGTWESCVGVVGPTSERCDELDNDCDGSVDEGFALNVTCDGPDGDSCKEGLTVCSADGTTTTCNDATPTDVEACNARDDDCDGVVDEGFLLGVTCDGPDGDLCAEGLTSCSADGTGTSCTDTTPTNAELCNGRDDDCNALVDEGFVLGVACDGPDGDLCKEGVSVCSADGTGTSCTDTTPINVEVCNGVDDDCDGTVDEGANACGGVCLLAAAPGAGCDGPDADLCTEGGWACNGLNQLACGDTTGDTVELCNGADDDCDGAVDEGFALGVRCDGVDDDVCLEGVSVCSPDGAATECNDNSPSNVETCNDVDDDCDGTVDEGENACGGVCLLAAAPGAGCDGPDADLCTEGGWACNGLNQLACGDTTGDTLELCNGADDDCDGAVDEGFALGVRCDGVDDDICLEGVTVCSPDGAATECNDSSPSNVETCNDVDDDCDGLVDEGDNGCGGVCTPREAPGSACDGPDADACAEGVWVCAGVNEVDCTDDSADSVERCNGLDDDCDAAVDEGFGVGAACTAGVGACAAKGTVVCDANAEGSHCGAAPGTPASEVCNGLDDDCDGAVDEDCDCAVSAVRPCGVSEGVCRFGVQSCVSGKWDGCRGAVEAVAEMCNGVDDDCDALVDESCGCLAGSERACGAEGGECREGSQKCVGGAWAACVGGVQPAEERCEGLDNDCDGVVDQLWAIGTPCSAGVGACRRPGVLTCTGDGSGAGCDAVAEKPAAETCNGIDDDCDGSVDEGCGCEPGVRAGCGTDQGECVAGVRTCQPDGTWGACEGAVESALEACNGLDDDCNGTTDEGCAGCRDGDERACGVTEGQCTAGRQSCTNDVWDSCAGGIASIPEACNGLDDDCDGQVDGTGGSPIVRPCYEGPAGSAGVGLCRPGSQSCEEGSWAVCRGLVLPTVEVCNGVDDDCDGQTDEDLGCGEAALPPTASPDGCGCGDLSSGAWGLAVLALSWRRRVRRSTTR